MPSQISPRTIQRPFVSICMTITADGRTASSVDSFPSYYLRKHRLYLQNLRRDCDAVLCNSGQINKNLNHYKPLSLKRRQLRAHRGQPENYFVVVVEGPEKVNPSASLFQKQFTSIIHIVPRTTGARRRQELGRVGDKVIACGAKIVNLSQALAQLTQQHNIRSLQCEGDSDLNSCLFRLGFVDELRVLIFPLILAGRKLPTLADGTGWKRLSSAQRLHLVKMRRCACGLSLIYRNPDSVFTP
jgi:riboflavin-specific deaminase-like protein